MSTINPTDQSRLDLSADVEFADLVLQRAQLAEAIQAGQEAQRQRKEIDTQIIAKLGNARSAMTAYGDLITTLTIKRKGYYVDASISRQVRVRHVKAMG